MNSIRDKRVFYDSTPDKIRFQDNVPSFNMPCMHFHTMYEIYILFDGHVQYLFPDKTYDMLGGSFILISPYDTHRKISISESYTTLLLEFTEAELLEYFTKEATHEILSPFSDNTSGKIAPSALERLLELAKILPRRKNDKFFVTVSIAEIIQILSNQTPIKPQKNIADKSIDRLVYEYVSNHVDEKITLDSLSAALFMSKQTLITKFRKDHNSTVMHYVTEIKLNYARAMLKHSDFSISTVSKYCGFKNHIHFSRIFRDSFGQSPSQYRKEVLENE